MPVRVFKTKTFARWVRKILTDSQLCLAAAEIEQGLFEADLGGGLCKKRIAMPGQGKSGSVRTLVAKKLKGRVFFLAGREKSQPGADFSDKEVDAVKVVGAALQMANELTLNELLDAGILKEICNEN